MAMFPEKLIFENNIYRTPKKHEVLSKLCSDNKAFEDNKKGRIVIFTILPSEW